MCSSCDAKIMAAPHPPAQERLTAESFTLGRMRVMNAVKSFVQASAASTAQNWVKLCPLLDQHSYSWECNWDLLEWACNDFTVLLFTTIKSHLLDTPTDVVLFFAFLPFIKETYLYSWAWNCPWFPKWAQKMELKHYQEVVRTASFLPHSPHPLHGMNSLTVLWATSLALLESNAHSPLFTSLYALHPRYLTLTSWFLINTVLERMPLLCNRFLSQKSHIFPWDFLSRYFNGKYVKLHHNKYAPPCTGSI